MFKFPLGARVRDLVTGFEGVITGRAEHLSGCNTYGVQPVAKDATDYKSSQWFDEPRLEQISKKVLVIDDREDRTGADSVPQSTRHVG